MHPVLLTLAAMLCGAPATIAALVFLPFSALVAVFSGAEEPLQASAHVVLVACAAFALGNYWSLAAKTVKEQPYELGKVFWLACIAGVLCAIVVFITLPVGAALLINAPIATAALLCIRSQRGIASRINCESH